MRVINKNEVRSFIETRYVSLVEVCYRILSKQLQCKSLSIKRLAVHLSQQQSIMIHDIDDDVAVKAALNRISTLSDYFDLNKEGISARQYTYAEVSAHYIFKLYFLNCIGRMHFVSTSYVKLFQLRLLLLNCRATKSFDELKNLNGVQYMTFPKACLALGVIDDDEEWSRAMQEAVSCMMPGTMRVLFV